MPRALINGLSLYFETLGSGDVSVVFIPGGHFPLERIRATAERLAETTTVLLYDNRNRGRVGGLLRGRHG